LIQSHVVKQLQQAVERMDARELDSRRTPSPDARCPKRDKASLDLGVVADRRVLCRTQLGEAAFRRI
jgi:hypothetical protein